MCAFLVAFAIIPGGDWFPCPIGILNCFLSIIAAPGINANIHVLGRHRILAIGAMVDAGHRSWFENAPQTYRKRHREHPDSLERRGRLRR